MSIAESRATTRDRLWTAEECWELPDEGVSRDLIDGRMRERPMTSRNQSQSTIEETLVGHLTAWMRSQARPRGRVVSGEAGFRLRRNPDTLVGIDAAVVSREVIEASPRATSFFDGSPTLAIEILSPSDRHEEIVEKVGLYLGVGTVVWVVDPDFRTIRIHEPGGEPPRTLNVRHILTDEPYLPGFTLAVAEVFEELD